MKITRMPKITVFLMILFCSVAAVWGVDYIWTGNSLVDATNWTDPANWDIGIDYPGFAAGDTATINSGNPVLSSMLPSSIGAITITGGSLQVTIVNTITGNVSGAGDLTINPGVTLSVGGNWDVSGSLTATGSTIAFTGNGSISSYGNSFDNIRIISGTRTAGAALNVTGTLTMSAGTGTLRLVGGDTVGISVLGTGTTIEYYNGGTTNIPNWPFQNLTIIDGTRTLSTNITVDGILNNQGTLVLDGKNINGTTTFVNTGILEALGNESIGNNINTVGGTVVFTGNGTGLAGITTFNILTISGGARVPVPAGALTVGANLTISGGSLQITNNSTVGGAVSGAGNLTIDSGVTLSVGGDWDVSGVLAATGSTVELTGPGEFFPNGRTFGNLTINGTYTDGGSFEAENVAGTGTLPIPESAEVTVNGDWTITNIEADEDSTVKLTGAGVTFIPTSQPFGNLTIDRDLDISTQTVRAAGTVIITNTVLNIIANGAAIIAANFSQNGGTISSNGDLTLTISVAANQAAGVSISATTALILDGDGSYSLENAANTVGSISTGGRTTGGAVSFINSGNLIVGYNNRGIITTSAVVTLTSNTGNITINNPINAGTAAASVVTLKSQGNVTQTAAITAGTLVLSGTVSYTLLNDNAVGTLRIDGAVGSIDFKNTVSLAIGTGGITTANAAVTLVSAGITGSGVIDAGTANVTLTSTGAVNLTGKITANELLLNSAGTAYTLSAGNEVTSISTGGVLTGVISFRNSTLLNIASAGIKTNGANVTLIVDGYNFDPGAVIAAGTGTVRITPFTLALDIEYGDSMTHSPPTVFYPDNLPITANMLIIGNTNHSGIIYMTGAASVSLNRTLQNNSRIDIEGDYNSANSLSLSSPNTRIVAASRSITAAGGIAFTGNITADAAGRDLTLTAGAGNIAVSGTVGTNAIRLGTLKIESVVNATFSYNPIYAAGFTQSAGTGTTTFNGTQNYSGDFSFTGNALNIYNSLTVGGSTTITNAGTFTKGTNGVITSAAKFEQDGNGANSIGQNIVVTGSGEDLIFKSALTVSPANNGTVAFTTNNGSINLQSTSPLTSTGTNRSFSLGAGTGNITINSTIALSGMLSIINLDASASFTVTGTSITATRGITQTGTGTNIIYGNISSTNYLIRFDGPISNGGFNTRNISINAGTGIVTTANIGAATPNGFYNITISGGAINLNGNVYSEHDVTVTNSGTLTVASAAGIYAQEVFTASGNVTNNGTIQAGPAVATGNDAIVFNGDYTGAGTGKIIGSSPAYNPNIVFKGSAVSFNANGIDLQNDVIKFDRTAAQTFNPGGNLFIGNIIVNNAAGIDVITASGTQTGTLTIIRGDFDVKTGWCVNSSALSHSNLTGFSGVSGTLTFGDAANQNTSLTTPGFNTSGGFTIVTAGTGTKKVSSSGDVTIAHTANDDIENVDFEITANAQFQLTAGKQIGNLVINGGTTTLRSAISVKYDVIIRSGTLDVSPSNHKITVNRHWRQYLGPNPFNPRQGVVEFTGVNGVISNVPNYTGLKEIHIQGSTTWYEFLSDTAAPIVIKFARNTQKSVKNVSHKFSNKFTVITAPNGTVPYERTLLTKMNIADYDTFISAAPTDGDGIPLSDLESNRDFFWNIEVMTANLIFDYVTVNYSWADPYSINLMPDRFENVDAVPHWGDSTDFDPYIQQYHYCVGWTEGIEFLYSFTEDTDHNGRIDRIRVQTSASFTGDFNSTAFDIEVDGYQKKAVPYSRIPGVSDILYINLEEQPYADGGNTLTWRLVKNDDAITEIDSGYNYSFVTYDEKPMTTIDTTWPVVSYSLMLPKNAGDTQTSQQLFIQFSEPVTAPVVNIPSLTVSDIRPISPFTVNSITYAKEYLIVFDSNDEITIQDMVDEIRYTINHSSTPPDYIPTPKDYKAAFTLLSPDYPYPRFPDDASYTSYSSNAPHNQSVPLLDNQNRPPDDPAADYTYRVTDVLISIPPADSADKRYFTWPFLGTDELGFYGPFLPGRDSVEWWDSSKPAGDSDLVTIRKFDGTGALRDSEITLNVKTHEDFLSPDLIIGVSVPDSFRASAKNGSEGLWLPYDSGLVPWRFQRIMQYTPNSVSPNNLLMYKINMNENDFVDDDVIDFYFQVFPGLSAGRLDMAPGARIPTDWYRKVKPFSFNINAMTYQRGGATILNNVINPTRGEKTYLNSMLTKSGQVTIQVFTLDGNLVQILYRGSRSAGEYIDTWDGKNRGGRVVARGMYFIRIVGPDIDEIRKVMVIR